MTPIYLDPKLEKILIDKGINPEDYRPAYGGESVGLDLYYTGEDTIITPYDRKKLLPTGLYVALPRNRMGEILERGSIIKTSVTKRAGVVDPGYTGEVFVNLVCIESVNELGTSSLALKHGDKLPVQMVIVVVETGYKKVTLDEYKTLTSNAQRLENKTGSSDAAK